MYFTDSVIAAAQFVCYTLNRPHPEVVHVFGTVLKFLAKF